LFTATPITTVNLLGAVISAVFLPYVQVGRTLLYLDLEARKAPQVPIDSATRRAE
jgi:hypothetical protein